MQHLILYCENKADQDQPCEDGLADLGLQCLNKGLFLLL